MTVGNFNVLSNTFRRTVTAVSQAIPQPVLNAANLPGVGPVGTFFAPPGVYDHRFTNVGTQAVFVTTAAPGAAAPTAAIPVDGANGPGFLVEAGGVRTFGFQYGTQFAAIAAAIGSDVYVTIGSGNNS